MVSDAELMELQDAGLARFAEIKLAAAEKLHMQIQAEDDNAVLCGLVAALERTGRSLRLCYALRMKLRREARKSEREEADAQTRRDRDQVYFRKQRLRTAVEALVWRETDNMDEEEEDAFDDSIHVLIDEEVCSETFLTENLADQVDRVVRKLGFEVTSDGRVVRASTAHPREGPASALPAFASSG